MHRIEAIRSIFLRLSWSTCFPLPKCILHSSVELNGDCRTWETLTDSCFKEIYIGKSNILSYYMPLYIDPEDEEIELARVCCNGLKICVICSLLQMQNNATCASFGAAMAIKCNPCIQTFDERFPASRIHINIEKETTSSLERSMARSYVRSMEKTLLRRRPRARRRIGYRFTWFWHGKTCLHVPERGWRSWRIMEGVCKADTVTCQEGPTEPQQKGAKAYRWRTSVHVGETTPCDNVYLARQL